MNTRHRNTLNYPIDVFKCYPTYSMFFHLAWSTYLDVADCVLLFLGFHKQDISIILFSIRHVLAPLSCEYVHLYYFQHLSSALHFKRVNIFLLLYLNCRSVISYLGFFKLCPFFHSIAGAIKIKWTPR